MSAMFFLRITKTLTLHDVARWDNVIYLISLITFEPLQNAK